MSGHEWCGPVSERPQTRVICEDCPVGRRIAMPEPSADYARGLANALRDAVALVDGYRERELTFAARQTLNELMRELEKLR